MSKKKKAVSSNWNNTEFAAVKITAELREEFALWLGENGSDYINFCEIMAGDGWKASQRWDGEHDCYICSLTMTDEDDRNYNVCLVSRSDNFAEAVLMNYFKAYVLYDKKKLPTEAPQDKWG